jgi:hypothetical protein
VKIEQDRIAVTARGGHGCRHKMNARMMGGIEDIRAQHVLLHAGNVGSRLALARHAQRARVEPDVDRRLFDPLGIRGHRPMHAAGDDLVLVARDAEQASFSDVDDNLTGVRVQRVAARLGACASAGPNKRPPSASDPTSQPNLMR